MRNRIIKFSFAICILQLIFNSLILDAYNPASNPEPNPPLTNDVSVFQADGWTNVQCATYQYPNRWGGTNSGGLYKIYGYGERFLPYEDGPTMMWRDEAPAKQLIVELLKFSNHSGFQYIDEDIELDMQNSMFGISVDRPWGSSANNYRDNFNVNIFVNPTNIGGTNIAFNLKYSYRKDTDESFDYYDRSPNSMATIAYSLNLPVWLRITHLDGDLCKGYYSTNGNNWVEAFNVYMTNLTGATATNNTLVNNGSIRFTMKICSGYTDDWGYVEVTNVSVSDSFDSLLLSPTNNTRVSNSVIIKSKIIGTNQFSGYSVYLNNNLKYTQASISGTNIITNSVFVTNLSENSTNEITVNAYSIYGDKIVRTTKIIVDNYHAPVVYFKDLTNNCSFPRSTWSTNIYVIQSNASKLIFYKDGTAVASNNNSGTITNFLWSIATNDEGWRTLTVKGINPGGEEKSTNISVLIDNFPVPVIKYIYINDGTAFLSGTFSTNIIFSMSNTVRSVMFIDDEIKTAYSNLNAFSNVITNYTWNIKTNDEGWHRIKVNAYNEIDEVSSNSIEVLVNNFQDLYGFIMLPVGDEQYTSGDTFNIKYKLINPNVDINRKIVYAKIFCGTNKISEHNNLTDATNIIEYTYTVPNTLALGSQPIKIFALDELNQVFSNSVSVLRILGENDIVSINPVKMLNLLDPVVTINFSCNIKDLLASVKMEDNNGVSHTGSITYTSDNISDVYFSDLSSLTGYVKIIISSIYNTVSVEQAMELYSYDDIKNKVRLKSKVYKDENFELDISNILKINQTVTIKIYDIKGRFIKELYNGSNNDVITKIYWDWRDENNKLVELGTYICIVRIKTDSGENVYKKVFIKVY